MPQIGTCRLVPSGRDPTRSFALWGRTVFDSTDKIKLDRPLDTQILRQHSPFDSALRVTETQRQIGVQAIG